LQEVHQACDLANRLTAALDDAIVNANALGAPMAKLDSQSLFVAAARRNEVNAIVAGLVAELGMAVRNICGALGWQELTLAKLKQELPADGAELERTLGEVRRRAADLHRIDDTNRVRGNRALAWMRILIAGHTGHAPGYNRRGTFISSPVLTTASRTL
jgi:hypothetical protein